MFGITANLFPLPDRRRTLTVSGANLENRIAGSGGAGGIAGDGSGGFYRRAGSAIL